MPVSRYKSKTNPDAKERYETNGLVIFRAPVDLWAFIQWLARAPHLRYRTISRLLTDSVVEFLDSEPWLPENGAFKIRVPKAPTSSAGPTGFKQCNAIIDSATVPVFNEDTDRFATKTRAIQSGAIVKEWIRRKCDEIVLADGSRFTMSSLMLTTLYWIVLVKHPSEAGLVK